MAKYGNIRSGKYASRKEAKRGAELLLLDRTGKISRLQEQVRYELIPAQYIDGKCVERSVVYVADFCYTRDGSLVIEDVKSSITRQNSTYIIKRKLMLWVHNIRVIEV